MRTPLAWICVKMQAEASSSIGQQGADWRGAQSASLDPGSSLFYIFSVGIQHVYLKCFLDDALPQHR